MQASCNLFRRRRHRFCTGAGLVAVGLACIQAPVSAAEIGATLVRSVETSAWSPPSPDPIGLAYNPITNRLLITDSEVEEMSIWSGANFFEVSLDGGVLSTSDLTGFTNEPTDVAFNRSNGRYYISDDNARKIFEIEPGADERIGTSDDTVTSFSSTPFNDAEGLAYGSGSLFIADGTGTRIHRVQPGPNGTFEGGGDDVITSFDTSALGQPDPEDVAFDEGTGNLFISSRAHKVVAEVTLDGSLVNTYDMTGTGLRGGSGITIAPSSTGPAGISMYIVDRGVDNQTNPDENDGRLFEFRLRGESVNKAPVVTSPPPQEHYEGDTAGLTIEAADEEGDTLTFTASGLPPGLSIDAAKGTVSGTIASGGSAGSPYGVTVTASDAGGSGSATIAWTIKDRVPPGAPSEVATVTQTNGLLLAWAPNPEADLAGYKVYRNTGVSSTVRLDTSPIQNPWYLDAGAPAGVISSYEITAVDKSGNESSASPSSARRPGITLVGATSNAGKVASLSLAKPGDITADDILLAVIGVRGGSDAVTAPPGWSIVTQAIGTGPAPLRQMFFSREAGSGEPSTYAFELGSVPVSAAGTLLAYRGVAPPITQAVGQVNESSTLITAPSQASAATNAAQVGCFGTAAGTSMTPPQGLVEQSEVARDSGDKLTLACADAIVGRATIGPRVATASTAAANIGQVVLLLPATPGADGSGTNVDDAHQQWRYSPGWMRNDHPVYSSRTRHYSNAWKAFTEVVVAGGAWRYVATTGPNMGMADVYIDDVFDTRVDLYSPRTTQQAAVAERPMGGVHTIRIQRSGYKNYHSTSGGINVDAVFVSPSGVTAGVYQDTKSTAWGFAGTWVTQHSRGYSSGARHLSNSRWSRANIVVAGTRIELRATKGPDMGILAIWIDGVLITNANLYRPATAQGQTIMLRHLPPGFHVVRLEVTGRRDPRSASGRVNFDVCVVT